MGSKYTVLAFDYPFNGYYTQSKNTQWLIVALFWTVVWSVKHFGVTLEKRG